MLREKAKKSVLVTSYSPDDLLREEAFDLASFWQNVCMEECKVKVFATANGPDYEVTE